MNQPASWKQISQYPTDAPPKKRFYKKRWFKITFSIILFLALVLIFLPTLLSTTPGKQFILSFVNDSIKGTVKVKSISLSWFGGQKLEGISLLDPKRNTVLTAKELTTELSIFSAATGDLDLGRLRLSGLDAKLIADENGSLNLLRAVESTKPSDPDKPTVLPKSLAGKIHLHDAKATYTAPNIETVNLTKADIRCTLTSITKPLKLAVKIDAQQGDLAGKLQLTGQIAKLINKSAKLTPASAVATLNADAENLPTDGIEQFVKLPSNFKPGFLRAALGESLTANIQTTASKKNIELALTLTSEHTDSNLNLTYKDGYLRLASPDTPAKIALNATTDFIRSHGESIGLKDIYPLNDIPITLNIQRLAIPLTNFNPKNVNAKITLQPIKVVEAQTGQRLGPVTLQNINASIDTTNLAQNLNLNFSADLQHANRPGKILIASNVQGLYDDQNKLQLTRLIDGTTIQLKDLPSVLVDRISGQKDLLTLALGQRLSLNLTAKPSGQNQRDLTLAFRSDKLNFDIPLTINQSAIALKPSFKPIQYKVPRALVARYLPKAKPNQPQLNLLEDRDLTLNISALSIPRPSVTDAGFSLNLQNAKLNFKLDIQDPTLAGLPNKDQVKFKDLSIALTGNTLASSTLTLNGKTILTNPDPAKTNPHNPWTDIGLALALHAQDPDAPITPKSINLTAASSLIQLALNATLSPEFDLTITPESKSSLTATLTPQQFAFLAPNAPKLTASTNLQLNINNLKTNLKQFSIAALIADISGSITPPSRPGPARTILGSPLNLSLKWGASNPDQPPTARIFLKSTNIHSDITGTLTLDDKPAFTANPDSFLRARATEELVTFLKSTLKLTDKQLPSIAGPTILRLTFKKLNAPITPFSLSSLVADTNIQIEPIVIASRDKRIHGASLEQTNADFSLDGPKNTATLNLNSALAAPAQRQPAPVTANLTFSNLLKDGAFNTSTLGITGSVKLTQAPTPIIQTFAPSTIDLPLTLGPTANLNTNIDLKSPTSGTFNTTITSKNLTATSSLTLADSLTQAKPTTIKWTITPDALASLLTQKPAPSNTNAKSASSPLTLLNSASATFTITSLAYPLKKDASQVPLIHSTLDIPTLNFLDKKTNQRFTITNLTANLKSDNLRKTTHISLVGDVEIDGSQTPGKINTTIKLENLLLPDNQFNKNLPKTFVRAAVTNLPGSFIAAFTGQNAPKTQTILGDKLTKLVLQADLKNNAGPVELNLLASNAKLNLKGSYDKGFLYLTQPLTADLYVTKDTGPKLLANIHPMFNTLQPRKDPITLLVPKQDFKLPLKNFDLNTTTIPNAKLTLGKLTMTNGGTLGTVISILQRARVLPGEQNETFDVQFTPLVVKLDKGRIDYINRLDLLVNQSVAIATWGKIDFANDEVDMILGITHHTLGHKIKSMKSDAIYPISLKGPLKKPGINQREAITNLGVVIAQSKEISLKRSNKDPLIAFAQKLLNDQIKKLTASFSKYFSSPQSVPPKSQNPVPWEKPASNPNPTP